MASNLKVDIVKPTATNGSLSLKGDSGGSATTNGISVDSSGDTSITGTTTISTADINGGNIDGTTIGGTTPAAGSFTDMAFNAGYGSVATAYGCRAWVNFDGTTNTGGNCDIRASGNVSSITDKGTGYYDINLTTAMSDANYSVVATVGNTGMTNASNYLRVVAAVALNSSTVRSVSFTSSSGTLTDVDSVNVSVFR